MDRFQEELELERRFRDNEIKTKKKFLAQLNQVYDLVNGDTGREIFNDVILPGLLKIHGPDISAAGLEALALLAAASFKPHTEVDSFLNSWAAEKIPGKGGIDSLEHIASNSPDSGVDLSNFNYISPLFLYSNDSRFRAASASWSPVYKSTDNRSLQLILTREISRKIPFIEMVIGAESARIIWKAYPAGYRGEIGGNEFNLEKGNDPLVISHGLLSETSYRYSSNEEYGFLYMVTSQGTRFAGQRRNRAEVPAVTAVFAVLSKQDYEEMVKNQFSDAEQFVLNILPDLWKAYLTGGGFFSKPKVIGRIDAKSPRLTYNMDRPFR